jgi:7-carboxy-7-deazaguanine synthase
VAYRVKEIFYTLQGEGRHTGRSAVFCRFSGCNLWTGYERHRASAICNFCDTDFIGTNGPGGGKFNTADELATAAAEAWLGESNENAQPFLVCTGGEPLMQLDHEAIDAFHSVGFRIAVETNGTRLPPDGLDWICVSPKSGAPLALERADELKLVFPQEGGSPDVFESFDAKYRFLQPMDGPDRDQNTKLAVEYCLAHPQWRLSLQTHKYLGIP